MSGNSDEARNLPPTLIALSDLHVKLKLRVMLANWSSIAKQSSAASKPNSISSRVGKPSLIDEQLHQAEQEASKDGSHTLFKENKTNKHARPTARVQLRDSQGRFLSPAEEKQALEQYSQEFFGNGEDFQLSGVVGALHIPPAEVQTQLSSIQVGKAVPKDCPPVVDWRSLGPNAVQHIADLLNAEVQRRTLDSKITLSCISWLPKPPQKPDPPVSLRPIGVIAPEGFVRD